MLCSSQDLNIIFKFWFWLLHLYSAPALILVISGSIKVAYNMLKGQFYQRPPSTILYKLTAPLSLSKSLDLHYFCFRALLH